jgi:hypothetical protein
VIYRRSRVRDEPFRVAFYPVILIHELFHYLPARAFGLNPELDMWGEDNPCVRFEGECSRVEAYIVLMLPFWVGFISFVAMAHLQNTYPTVGTIGMFLTGVIWIGSIGHDNIIARHIIANGPRFQFDGGNVAHEDCTWRFVISELRKEFGGS